MADDSSADPAEERLYLLGLDGSEYSIGAFEWVVRMATPGRDRVFVVTVAREKGLKEKLSNVNNEAFDEDRLLERELMDAYVERLAELDLRPTAIYDQSNKPGVVLCALAGQDEFDALVIGSRGRSSVTTALLGSVSRYCVEHAPCPVVVVKSKGSLDS